jgi:hypothetical protein
MPKAAAWTPVQVQTETTIRGGVGRKHHVLSVERFLFEDRESSFTIVSPNETWLCEIVAGQSSSRRPLARSSIFKHLRCAFASEVAGSIGAEALQDERMQDLGFEDSPSTSPSPAAKAHKRSRGPSHKGVDVRIVKVPADPPSAPAVAGNAGSGEPAVCARGGDREILAATKAMKLFIEVNALSWLVCFLRREFDAGFVPAVESAPAVAAAFAPAVWWDFRDECWVGRERSGLSGEKRRRQRKSIRSRMAPGGDLQHMTFENAKTFCYDELYGTLGAGETAAVAEGLPLALADGERAAAAAALS